MLPCPIHILVIALFSSKSEMRPEPGAVVFLIRLLGNALGAKPMGVQSQVDEASNEWGLPVYPLANAFAVEAFGMASGGSPALAADPRGKERHLRHHSRELEAHTLLFVATSPKDELLISATSEKVCL